MVTDNVLVLSRGTDYNREILWRGCWICFSKPFRIINDLEGRLSALEKDVASRVEALETLLYGRDGFDKKEEWKAPESDGMDNVG